MLRVLKNTLDLDLSDLHLFSKHSPQILCPLSLKLLLSNLIKRNGVLFIHISNSSVLCVGSELKVLVFSNLVGPLYKDLSLKSVEAESLHVKLESDDG